MYISQLVAIPDLSKMIHTTCLAETNHVSMEMSYELHSTVVVASSSFTLLATVASLWLLWQHLSNYTHPIQQRNIVRILSFVPAYTLLAWMRYLWDPQSSAFDIVSAFYGALIIVSLFTLLLQYVGDAPAQQHTAFLKVRLVQGPCPLGWFRSPIKSGLGFLWFMKVAILQYVIFLPTWTVLTALLRSVGWYCETSWQPGSGQSWLSIIYTSSLILAAYCLLIFYCTISHLIEPHDALFELAAVEITLVLCIWPRRVIRTNWIEFQIEADIFSATFRVALIALLHVKAFRYSIYRSSNRVKTRRWRAVQDAADCRDLVAQMKEFVRLIYREDRGYSKIVSDDIRAETLQHHATDESLADKLEEIV